MNDVSNSSDIALTDAEIRTSLTAIRDLLKLNDKAGQEARDSHKERNAKLAADGFVAAVPLVQDRNASVLDPILNEHGMKPASNVNKLLEQVASLQLGHRDEKTKEWKVRSRRDERAGRIYSIFYSNPGNWPHADADALRDAILAAGGVQKVIEANAVIDTALEKRKSKYRLAVANDKLAPVIPVADMSLMVAGADWKLALVSVHSGELRYHGLVRGMEKTALKEANAYSQDRYAEILRETREAEDEKDEQVFHGVAQDADEAAAEAGVALAAG